MPALTPVADGLAPPPDCQSCPRLAGFREANRQAFPAFHNAPVPAFGDLDARLLIVGLAPGLKGANQTGRPFTGDYAGDLLYATLLKFGLALGAYGRHAGDGMRLAGCRITNAVRCVPPANKPTGAEIRTCRQYLEREIAALGRLEAIVALGSVSHGAVIAARGLRQASFKFAHGAAHDIGDGLRLFDSYHCSRYNTNTGRLTEAMFEGVFARVVDHLAR
ncbi:MAG: uracil-DNA glycosylase [Azospirillaceae bacterium]